MENSQDITDALIFISSYRAFENTSANQSTAIIKEIVSGHKADHLCSSWLGRSNDFGSFFSNLDYKVICQLLVHFGIKLDGYDKYLENLEKSPFASMFATPPLTASKLVQLMVYFNNHSIDDVEDIIVSNLSVQPENRYGNSTNWGDFILDLKPNEQYNILNSIFSYTLNNVLQKENNRKLLEKELLKKNKDNVFVSGKYQ